RVCKNVTSEGKTRQKQAKKRSLGVLNEHFSPVFNAVLPSAVVFTQSGPGAAGLASSQAPPPDQRQDSAVTYVAICVVSAIAIEKRFYGSG
ncbi:hypothetical protein, partial [Pseudomonas savastanoi]